MLLAAATLWLLWTAFLALPLVGAPVFVIRTVAGLLGAQFIALLALGSGGATCRGDACGSFVGIAGAAARHDVPALTAALLALTVLHGLYVRAR